MKLLFIFALIQIVLSYDDGRWYYEYWYTLAILDLESEDGSPIRVDWGNTLDPEDKGFDLKWTVYFDEPITAESDQELKYYFMTDDDDKRFEGTTTICSTDGMTTAGGEVSQMFLKLLQVPNNTCPIEPGAVVISNYKQLKDGEAENLYTKDLEEFVTIEGAKFFIEIEDRLKFEGTLKNMGAYQGYEVDTSIHEDDDDD